MPYAHDEKLDRSRVQLATFVSFFMGFSQAMLAYVMSSYFELSSGTQNVGIFYTVAYVIVLLMLLNLHKVVKKIGKSNILYFSILAKLITVSFLIFAAPGKLGMLLLMVYIIAGNLEVVSLDTIIESFSEDKFSGRIRGLHLTILNLGFLLGPFTSTYLLGQFDFHGVFTAALVIDSLVLIFSLIGFRHVNHRFNQDIGVVDLIKKVLAKKNVMRIYYISFVLEFFYALMIIYTPLYLRDSGFSWEKIGEIFTVMLIPFVLVQYPVGFLADKRTGEKEFLIFSIVIMGLSTMAIFFMGSASVVAWAIILFITRIGAALIEILRDSYFYKQIDARDVDIINFFRTSLPMAYILASVISSFVLFFFPIKASFLIVAVIVLTALIPAIRLTDSKCEAEVEAETKSEAY